MDTISRENNSSMLPVGGIIVGVIGLLLGGFGLVQASKAVKAIEAAQPKIEKIDGLADQVTAADQKADRATKDLKALKDSTQSAFDTVGPALNQLQTSVARLEELTKKPVAVADKGGKKGGGPVVAGPDEYVIKSGDSGMKIAKAHNVSLADLNAVNPGIDWTKVKPGQKVKLPVKK
jgi:LysM repeat protein